jgi:phage major head subunit gpT-like protein
MPIVRGQYAENLAPGLNFRTFNAYRERPEIFSRIVNVQNSSRAYEEDWANAGFGPLAEKGELETTILDEPIKLGGVRFIHKAYALGFVISEEMREDDQYTLMNDLAGSLGKSSRYTAELYGHDVYNNAFTSAKYVGRDGQPLVSTAHPVYGGAGTASNRPAVDVDLSEAALEAAWTNFQLQVDDRGMPIDLMPTTLIVHPSNVLYARRLLESASLNTYGENPGEINPLQGMVRIVSSPYLTDPDAWFITAAANEVDIRFYWRKRPDTKTWDDDDADATFHKIKQRHSTGFGDWRGVYGSSGG